MNEQYNRDLHMPVYNIKAVSRLVGLLPVTLRAWERRYGLPAPGRGNQGYRFYSEHDVRTLRWLKAKIETGLSIGRAVKYLAEIRTHGFDPAYEPVFADPAAASSIAAPGPVALDEQLYEALIRFDELAARDVMQRAYAHLPVDRVLTQVVQPVLVDIGDAWHRGEIVVAAEHFASQFIVQHLMSQLASAAPPTHPGSIVAACAPGEQHQMGLLSLVVLLRWRGWDVKYLGPDLPLDRLEEWLRSIRPRVLMFSATRVETARGLRDLPEILAGFPHPLPVVLLGGAAFRTQRLPEGVPTIYLDAPLAETVEKIEAIMRHS